MKLLILCATLLLSSCSATTHPFLSMSETSTIDFDGELPKPTSVQNKQKPKPKRKKRKIKRLKIKKILKSTSTQTDLNVNDLVDGLQKALKENEILREKCNKLQKKLINNQQSVKLNEGTETELEALKSALSFEKHWNRQCMSELWELREKFNLQERKKRESMSIGVQTDSFHNRRRAVVVENESKIDDESSPSNRLAFESGIGSMILRIKYWRNS